MLGDDTPIGWALTLAYAVGALVTLFAGATTAGPPAVRRFVLASGSTLFLLCLNKQLDLQTLVFVGGREALVALGVWERRAALQVLFPIVVGLVLLASLGWLVRALRPHLRLIAPMLAGFGLLAAYVVVRVALFSQLARLLGWSWLESEASALLELAAIVVVALGALRVRAGLRTGGR